MRAQGLWKWAEEHPVVFEAEDLVRLPARVQDYLQNANATGSPLSRAVRLTMHGQIRMNGWLPFKAEEVIVADKGLIWEASTKMKGLPVSGSDRILDGQARMQWKILRVFPVVTADGPDVTRSAAGRMAAECVWLPSFFARRGTCWTAHGNSEIQVLITIAGQPTELILGIGPHGNVLTIAFMRWGNPNHLPFGMYSFGGYIEEESVFGDYRIPSKLRLGWHFGTERFENDGEFFRVFIDSAQFL